MKPKFLWLIAAFIAISFSACQKQETYQTPESVAVMTKPDASKNEPGQAGTRAVTIAATYDWTAVSNDAWITVSPSSGGVGIQEVVLSFQENNTGAVRKGSVTFTAGSYSESYMLTQNPAEETKE